MVLLESRTDDLPLGECQWSRDPQILVAAHSSIEPFSKPSR